MTEPLVYSDAVIKSYLDAVKTIAVVGASNKEMRPSSFVIKYLQAKGFQTIPINPGLAGQKIAGETVYGSLAELPAPVDMVDIFRNSEAAGQIVEEVLALSWVPKIIWMQQGVRNDAAAERAQAADISVVMDRCPKIEWARLNGEIGWGGISSGIISSKRRKLTP